MIIVKLIVLYIFSAILRVCCANYCEICRNHTLCLYSVPGPSNMCEDYDNAALLKMNELEEIVNKINERRNFVALGLSKFLPQAANMKRIVWSSELAITAQRWADQCDQSLHPDKEDMCRDLVDTKVGQNVATILGSSPGLNVKSFVEMWFLQTLDYKGSVAFYNKTQDHNTKYFTQLIWADTEIVGCGKAKFYIAERSTMAERLVCNFAPSGNIHGKPVYTIGYPGTQCENNMIPDISYPGLCYNKNENVRKFTTRRSPVSSLLRILNLSNNSLKQEIDPIGNNLKQINFNGNKTKDQRNQKIRHVYFNNTYGGIKRVPSKQLHSSWNSPPNVSQRNNFQERGHSRVYHGDESLKNNHEPMHERHNIDNFPRQDYTTEPINTYANNDRRKYNRNQQCTRKIVPVKSDSTPSECITDTCTRGQKNNNYRQHTSLCESHAIRQVLCTNANEKQCLCDKQTTVCPSVARRCSCNINCQCLNIGCTTSVCSNMRSRIKENKNQDEIRKSDEVHYYDLPPNLAIRSGDEKSPLIASSFNSSQNNISHFDQSLRQVKDRFGYSKLTHQDLDYLYGSFDSSERKRRELGDQNTFKPFWQMDEYNYKLPSELKAIKYTTLSNKRNRKTRRTILSATPIIATESITMKLRETPPNQNHRAHGTEKYLSFEELMHLRKLSTGNVDKEARRKAGDENSLRQETPKSETTTTTASEYTTNTPFVRKKHCTRKLTCTWTAFTITGIDGNVLIPGGGAIDHGSRTPPGYVEGCSRTSTCTREYMDRNKFASVTDESSTISSPEDEDYCERRSLNLRRRHSEEKTVTEIHIGYQESFTDKPTSTMSTPKIIDQNVHTPSYDVTDLQEQNSCLCYDETSRRKRNDNNNNDYLNIDINGFNDAIKNSISKQSLSHGELYTLVLQQKLKSSESTKVSYRSSKCSCSCTFGTKICKYLICLTLCIIIYK